MPSYTSHTHTVGAESFAVHERSSQDMQTMWTHFSRDLVRTSTGEIVRRWSAANGMSLPPYNFTEEQQRLEREYGPKNNMAWTFHSTYNNNTGGSNAPINTNTAYISGKGSAPGSAPAVTQHKLVGAEYFASCLYGGLCNACGREISKGDPIWWRRAGKKSSIWCGAHKEVKVCSKPWIGKPPHCGFESCEFSHEDPATGPAATAVGQEHDKEQDDMAQRQDFTFPYTGAEIAAALEQKAAGIDALVEAPFSYDEPTLRLIYKTDLDLDAFVEREREKRKNKNDGLAKQAAKLRTEARPYAKADKQSFDIDVEDIEHFGLADDDAPAPRTRKTRISRKPSEPLSEEVSA